MKTILLTGGLGYIGSHIALELLNSTNEYTVIIIDNLSNCSISRLEAINKNKINKNNQLIFNELDMIDINKLELLFITHNIDIVIHLAGLKSVGESVKNPILYYKNNLYCMLNLITIMEKHNCNNLIFSSSATVYGNNKAPYYENMSVGINMSNPYGKTKYIQEEMLKDLYKSNNNWNIIILRYFNPIGHKITELKEEPNGIPNNLFPYIIKVYNKELPILQIFGNDYNTNDGTCVRDFIHVVDLAKGHINSCEYIFNNINIELKIYNLGTGNGTSVKQLIGKFEEINNTKINYKYVERREGDLDISYADVSLAYNELNWKTENILDDMVLI